MTTAQKRTATDARTLISTEMRERLVDNMRAKFPKLTDEKADRGVGQMLAFLAACAYSERPLSPSPLVDDFWHAFLLHEYAKTGRPPTRSTSWRAPRPAPRNRWHDPSGQLPPDLTICPALDEEAADHRLAERARAVSL
ncbi:hypothetical protein [Streptomyces himalayensis]|uniref:Uncharacterized protein n=1 Tax=Streptomyces himalayensis subsp. himalayensis TaxID=2756131 RepID=A0A7W0DT04_9ACTN|nr:hypothetical protein [Streptomyces himalayensis]MBA2950701.1 hypothetical protein [Streptomyces himalayensis subsp. himalayensis]